MLARATANNSSPDNASPTKTAQVVAVQDHQQVLLQNASESLWQMSHRGQAVDLLQRNEHRLLGSKCFGSLEDFHSGALLVFFL